MTDKHIEESLNRAVHASTPDLLDTLMEEISEYTQTQHANLRISEEPSADLCEMDAGHAGKGIQRPFYRRTWFKTAAALAACVLVVIIAGVKISSPAGRDVYAVIGLDVNPSIEISIDKNSRVLSANALNQDGEDVLSGLDLKGTDKNTACYAVIGSMLTHGYLTLESNSILISVHDIDEEHGLALEHALSDDLNTYLENSAVQAAILGEYVRQDDDLIAFSKEHGISLGKSCLIRNLYEADVSHQTMDSLLQLSTQELVLLGQEKLSGESGSFYGRSDTSSYIGEEKAIAAALKKAGVGRREADNIEVSFECENGVLVYEVEFTCAGKEYEIDVHARTGETIAMETEATAVPAGDKNRSDARDSELTDADEDTDEDSDAGDKDSDDASDKDSDDDSLSDIGDKDDDDSSDSGADHEKDDNGSDDADDDDDSDNDNDDNDDHNKDGSADD